MYKIWATIIVLLSTVFVVVPYAASDGPCAMLTGQHREACVRQESREAAADIAEEALKTYGDEVITIVEDEDGNKVAGKIEIEVEQCLERRDAFGAIQLDADGEPIIDCEMVTHYFDPDDIDKEDGLVPGGTSGEFNVGALRDAYNPATGADGKFLDARARAADDALSRSECEPPAPGEEDVRPDDCFDATTTVYGIFTDGADTRNTTLQDFPQMMDTTETIYENLENFAGAFIGDFEMCASGDLTYTTTGERVSYQVEERTCYQMNTHDGECTGTQTINARLISPDLHHSDTFRINTSGVQSDHVNYALAPAGSNTDTYSGYIEWDIAGDGIHTQRTADLADGKTMVQEVVDYSATEEQTVCQVGDEMDWRETGYAFNTVRYGNVVEGAPVEQGNENFQTSQEVEVCTISDASEAPAVWNWDWSVHQGPLDGITYEREVEPFYDSPLKVVQELSGLETTAIAGPIPDWMASTYTHQGFCLYEWTETTTIEGASGGIKETHENTITLSTPTEYFNIYADSDFDTIEEELCEDPPNNVYQQIESRLFDPETIEETVRAYTGETGYRATCDYTWDQVLTLEQCDEDGCSAQDQESWPMHAQETITCQPEEIAGNACQTRGSDFTSQNHPEFTDWMELPEHMASMESYSGYCQQSWRVRSTVYDAHGSVVESTTSDTQSYIHNRYQCQVVPDVGDCSAATFSANAIEFDHEPFGEGAYQGEGADLVGLPSTPYRQVLRLGGEGSWSSGGDYDTTPAEQSLALRVDNPDAIKRVYAQYVVHDDTAAVHVEDDQIWASDPIAGRPLLYGGDWNATHPPGPDPGMCGVTMDEPSCTATDYAEEIRYRHDPRGGEFDNFNSAEFRTDTRRSCRAVTKDICNTPPGCSGVPGSFCPETCTEVFSHRTCGSVSETHSETFLDDVVFDWTEPRHTVYHPGNTTRNELNIDITEYFQGKSPGDTVQLRGVFGRGVSTGGFVQFVFDYYPDEVITDHLWGPDKCMKGVLDIGTGWATGTVECQPGQYYPDSYVDDCIDVPLNTYVDNPTAHTIRVCRGDLMDSVHNGVTGHTILDTTDLEWNCNQFDADVEYIYAKGEDEEDLVTDGFYQDLACDALEQDEACERITMVGGESCLEGAKDPVTGFCQINRVEYECRYNPISIPTDVEVTLACNDALFCEGGSCQDQIVADHATMEDLGRVAMMMSITEQVRDEMHCDVPDDIESCGLFAGREDSCARRGFTTIEPCEPGDEDTRPECSDDNERDYERWEDPETGNWMFDGGNDCCDQQLDGAEENLHQLTVMIRDMLNAQQRMGVYKATQLADQYHGDDGYTYLTQTAEESDGNFLYDEFDDFLVSYESSLHALSDGEEAPEIETKTDGFRQGINDSLESIFGADYGAVMADGLETALIDVYTDIAEDTAIAIFGESTIGSLAGPLGTALTIHSAAEFVVGWISSCSVRDNELWMERRQGNCVRVNDGECSGSFLGRCRRIEQTYCCYDSILARLIQEAARGNRLGVDSFDDPAVPGLSWKQGGEYLCEEPLTLRDLEEMDWEKVKIEQFIDHLYRTDQVPTDEDGNPQFGMQLTGEQSRLQMDGEPPRPDAIERTQRRLNVPATEVGIQNIRQDMDENFEIPDRLASKPWYNDYDAILCEYDHEGEAPNNRYECTHMWAPAECDNAGYSAHGVCQYIDQWAADCSPADLSVTLSDECQEFRAFYCDMDRYNPGNNATCGVMGDADLMATVEDCESADFWDFMSGECLIEAADQVCSHSYFTDHNICSPDTAGPVSDQADQCLDNPEAYGCYELNQSVACEWHGTFDLENHPTCEPKPWDDSDIAVQCEYDSQEGESFRERGECITWAIDNCDDPDNEDHRMCLEVDQQMAFCDTTNIGLTTSPECQERRTLYCHLDKYDENPVCNQPGDVPLMDQFFACQDADFGLFVSDQCQDLRDDLCDYSLFSASDICMRTSSGPAKERADACNSSNIDTLITDDCKEFTQSPACDWPGWSSNHPACLNEIASYEDISCGVTHDPSSNFVYGVTVEWDRGVSHVQKGREFYGFDGELVDQDCPQTIPTYGHQDSTEWIENGAGPDIVRELHIETLNNFDGTVVQSGVGIRRTVQPMAPDHESAICPNSFDFGATCNFRWFVKTDFYDHDEIVYATMTSAQHHSQRACTSTSDIADYAADEHNVLFWHLSHEQQLNMMCDYWVTQNIDHGIPKSSWIDWSEPFW